MLICELFLYNFYSFHEADLRILAHHQSNVSEAKHVILQQFCAFRKVVLIFGLHNKYAILYVSLTRQGSLVGNRPSRSKSTTRQNSPMWDPPPYIIVTSEPIMIFKILFDQGFPTKRRNFVKVSARRGSVASGTTPSNLPQTSKHCLFDLVFLINPEFISPVL